MVDFFYLFVIVLFEVCPFKCNHRDKSHGSSATQLHDLLLKHQRVKIVLKPKEIKVTHNQKHISVQATKLKYIFLPRNLIAVQF